MDGDGPPTSARSGCGWPTWTAPMVGRPAAFGGDAEVGVAGGPGLRARAGTLTGSAPALSLGRLIQPASFKQMMGGPEGCDDVRRSRRPRRPSIA